MYYKQKQEVFTGMPVYLKLGFSNHWPAVHFFRMTRQITETSTVLLQGRLVKIHNRILDIMWILTTVTYITLVSMPCNICKCCLIIAYYCKQRIIFLYNTVNSDLSQTPVYLEKYFVNLRSNSRHFPPVYPHFRLIQTDFGCP